MCFLYVAHLIELCPWRNALVRRVPIHYALCMKASTHLKQVLKLCVSIGALAFIFSQLELDALIAHFHDFSPLVLVSAWVLCALGQYIAARRLYFYCQSRQISIEKMAAIRLYFIGGFFNQLLPGGIGGDGYIALMLRRHYQSPLATNIRLLLSARASGLLVLMLITCLLATMVDALAFSQGYLWIALVALASVLGYTLCARRLLREHYKTQATAAVYSGLGHGLIVAFSYLLIQNLGASPDGVVEYLALLMLSNILLLIPLSFGGLGLRELGLLYGAQFLGLNPELCIAVSLLHYSLVLLTSLIGLWFFIQNKPRPVCGI